MIDFCHPVMWSFFTLPQIAIGCCFIHTRYNRHKGDIMNNAIMRVVLTGRKKKKSGVSKFEVADFSGVLLASRIGTLEQKSGIHH